MRYFLILLVFFSCTKEEIPTPQKQEQPVVQQAQTSAYKFKSIVDTTITQYLSTPAVGAKLIIPVVIIDFIPTDTNGVLLESVKTDLPSVSGAVSDLDKNDVFNWTLNNNERAKFAIEEGSKFHAYSNSSELPYVGIKVIKYFKLHTISFYNNTNVPNYKALFDSIGLQKLVEEEGVKEVWFNYSLGVKMMVPESNMSSPYGDVSNSLMDKTDLPVYNKTYVVYGHYYKGTYAEMIHCRGHQIEAQMRNIDDNFFSNKFVGKVGTDTEGRCGNTHFTPNSTKDYDYDNGRKIASDIADWNPNGGKKDTVTSITWKKEIRNSQITINKTKSHTKWNMFIGNWIGGGDPHGAWLVYWFQSIPSEKKITFDGKVVTNWWDIFYNWDDAKKKQLKLYN